MSTHTMSSRSLTRQKRTRGGGGVGHGTSSARKTHARMRAQQGLGPSKREAKADRQRAALRDTGGNPVAAQHALAQGQTPGFTRILNMRSRGGGVAGREGKAGTAGGNRRPLTEMLRTAARARGAFSRRALSSQAAPLPGSVVARASKTTAPPPPPPGSPPFQRPKATTYAWVVGFLGSTYLTYNYFKPKPGEGWG